MQVSKIIWLIVSFNVLLLFCTLSSQERCPDGTIHVVRPNKYQHRSDSLEFLISPKNTTHCLSQTARLRVFFLGDNFTQVNWYKDQPITGSAQRIVIDGKKYHMVPGEENDQDDYYLYICDLTLEDAGWYTIELRNRIGPIFRRAFINVRVCNDVSQLYRSGSVPLVTDSNALLTSSQTNASRNKIIFLVLGLVLLVFVAGIVVCCCCRQQTVTKQRRRRSSGRKEVVHVNPIYNQIPAPLPPDAVVLLPSDPRWEIQQDSLHLEDLLGEGAFGKVYRGSYIGHNCPSVVAIKMLKDDCSYKDRTDFVKEIEMMKTIGRHRNIICFYGYGVTREGCIRVVVEFAKHGNLRDFLRRLKPAIVAVSDAETRNDGVDEDEIRQDRNREDGEEVKEKDEAVYFTPVQSQGDDGSARQLTFSDLVSFCFQVARGMEYLSSLKIIHRDLAARNILVADDRVLKIADFGLTRNTQVRNYYQRTSSGLLPVMWMAPESLADNRYTTMSDVWSFGVLLWEIFSFGADPYAGIPPEELLDQLLQGFRLEKPEFCSDEVAEIMWRCWELNPISRPIFTELVKCFDRFVTSSTSVHYLSLEHLTEDDTDNDDVFQVEPLPCQPAPDTHFQVQHPQSSADSQYASLSSPCQSSSSLGDNTGTLLAGQETGSVLESDRLTLDSVSTDY